MFGQSVVLSEASTVDVSGGQCGGPVTVTSVPYLRFNLSMTLTSALYLSDDACLRVAMSYIDNLLLPRFIDTLPNSTIVSFNHSNKGNNQQEMTGNFLTQYEIVLNVTVSLVDGDTDDNVTSTLSHVWQSLMQLQAPGRPAVSGFSVLNQQILPEYQTIRHLESAYEYDCPAGKSGSNGTVYQQFVSQPAFAHIVNQGVESTDHSYFYSSRNFLDTRVSSDNGFTTPLRSSFAPSKPTRVTFYLKIDSAAGPYITATYGTYLALTSSGLSEMKVDPVGVFLGGQIKYGSSVPWLSVQEGASHATSLHLQPMEVQPLLNTWIKFDIKLNWKSMTFKVFVNDTQYVASTPFKAPYLDGIRIDPSSDVAFFIDELYVGFDASRDFSCPLNNAEGVTMPSAVDSADSVNSLAKQQAANHFIDVASKKMVRHYNHLNFLGTLAFDGQGGAVHRVEQSAYLQANSTVRMSGTSVPASALVEDPVDGRILYYYFHYDYPLSNESLIQDSAHPYNYLGHDAVASCSTKDGETWKFEGLVFQSINASDTVSGTPEILVANITNSSSSGNISTNSTSAVTNNTIHVDRPSVVYNSQTKQFVMWMNLDNYLNSLHMAAIATAPFADGPFLFLRSLYPDGNQTDDQVLSTTRVNSTSTNAGSAMKNENMTFAFSSLIRSYDYTVEYVKPAAISQPVWESVKFDNGSVNYRVNYHRAYYAVGYDNYHDIYLQRWRQEDQPWKIICVDKITGSNRTTSPASPDCIG